MTADVIDPISATRSLLAEGLGEEIPVFAHELPDDQDDAMPRKCVVVSGSGGPAAGGYLPIGKQRLDSKAFGATHAEAMEVAILVHGILKPLRRTVVDSVVIHGFEPSSGYTTLRDADARWPLVLRTYVATHDERAAA